MTTACPVCRASSPQPFLTINGRDYWLCNTCEARFLDPAHYPGPDDERAQYLHHENHPDDPGYRKFLSKLADPLIQKLTQGMRGLDYGCGPGPALAAMLTDAGHEMTLYDPFFHREPAALEQMYNFISCTEVAEHFHHPADEFDRLDKMLSTRRLARCDDLLPD